MPLPSGCDEAGVPVKLVPPGPVPKLVSLPDRNGHVWSSTRIGRFFDSSGMGSRSYVGSFPVFGISFNKTDDVISAGYFNDMPAITLL